MKNCLALLSICFLASNAAARRSSENLGAPSQRNMVRFGTYPWGYPYGWGLDGPMVDVEKTGGQTDTKAVKEVKSVKKEATHTASKKPSRGKRASKKLPNDHFYHNPFVFDDVQAMEVDDEMVNGLE